MKPDITAIAKDPKRAYYFALNVLKDRFPEGEAAIASSSLRSFWYAHDIIGGRWPEGEAAIATDPEWAYNYARYIIKGRWPEGEAVISGTVWGDLYRSIEETIARDAYVKSSFCLGTSD